MARFTKKINKRAGISPGKLINVPIEHRKSVKIQIIDYDSENLFEREVKTVEECFTFKDKSSVTWINIDGLSDIEVLEKIGKQFEIHPLVLEDIVQMGQRPKFEDFESYLFIVLKMLYYNEAEKETQSEQFSLILGKDYVISFQEKNSEFFEVVKERIRKGRGRMRKLGPDYLAYALLDTVVDNYFIVLEKIGDKIEDMEDEVLKNPLPETLQAIHQVKSDMIFIRKSIWPLREVFSRLSLEETHLIQGSTSIYFKDVYDHTVQAMDTVESLKDMSAVLLDIFLSSVSNRMTEASNRMNEVMKVLTIFASIFIPLTFIVGVYGMNFDYMPELRWRYGYFMVWGVMITLTTVMLMYFRRKRWL